MLSRLLLVFALVAQAPESFPPLGVIDFYGLVVVEADVREEQGRPLCGVNGIVCPKKEKREQKIQKKFLTRAGIVRDVGSSECDLESC